MKIICKLLSLYKSISKTLKVFSFMKIVWVNFLEKTFFIKTDMTLHFTFALITFNGLFDIRVLISFKSSKFLSTLMYLPEAIKIKNYLQFQTKVLKITFQNVQFLTPKRFQIKYCPKFSSFPMQYKIHFVLWEDTTKTRNLKIKTLKATLCFRYVLLDLKQTTCTCHSKTHQPTHVPATAKTSIQMQTRAVTAARYRVARANSQNLY